MKLSELSKSESAVADATVSQSEGGKDAATAAAAETVVLAPEGSPSPSVETPPSEQFETVTTPSGLEILYSWAPKRLYRLNGDEVPSVTSVLGVLDKPQLVWWSMKIGVDGVRELVKRLVVNNVLDYETEELVDLLTQHKLTCNHVRDSAADRGVNVHGVLEKWVADGAVPLAESWPDRERGYVQGLRAFLEALAPAAGDAKAEIMVGSLEHRYAGRYDLEIVVSRPFEAVIKSYPKRADKVAEIPAGRHRWDLKTSKTIQPSYFMQLEAYEKASVECGYEPSDYRGVLHVTADGRYELVLNEDWAFEDFQAVRGTYAVLHERDRIKNEREVLSILENELGAHEVKQ